MQGCQIRTTPLASDWRHKESEIDKLSKQGRLVSAGARLADPFQGRELEFDGCLAKNCMAVPKVRPTLHAVPAAETFPEFK